MTDPLAEAERRFRGSVQIPVPLAAPPTVEQLRVLFAEYDRMRRDIHGVITVIAERDHLHAALTELIHASRGLAFFDQIKFERWNTAYARAREVVGMEEEQ